MSARSCCSLCFQTLLEVRTCWAVQQPRGWCAQAVYARIRNPLQCSTACLIRQWHSRQAVEHWFLLAFVALPGSSNWHLRNGPLDDLPIALRRVQLVSKRCLRSSLCPYFNSRCTLKCWWNVRRSLYHSTWDLRHSTGTVAPLNILHCNCTGGPANKSRGGGEPGAVHAAEPFPHCHENGVGRGVCLWLHQAPLQALTQRYMCPGPAAHRAQNRRVSYPFCHAIRHTEPYLRVPVTRPACRQFVSKNAQVSPANTGPWKAHAQGCAGLAPDILQDFRALTWEFKNPRNGLLMAADPAAELDQALAEGLRHWLVCGLVKKGWSWSFVMLFPCWRMRFIAHMSTSSWTSPALPVLWPCPVMAVLLGIGHNS